MTMRPVVAGLIGGWLLVGTVCAPARGDGGTVRLAAKKGDYQITVFSAPTPLRAGPVDISVLVQDAVTGDALPLARVVVRLTQPGQPELEYLATAEAATNKLLQATQFDLPASGRWDLEVQVEGAHGLAVLGCTLEVAEPLPRWLELWPWICWPALAVAVFAIHRMLARPRHQSS
jgi:hypothetical protein